MSRVFNLQDFQPVEVHTGKSDGYWVYNQPQGIYLLKLYVVDDKFLVRLYDKSGALYAEEQSEESQLAGLSQAMRICGQLSDKYEKENGINDEKNFLMQ